MDQWKRTDGPKIGLPPLRGHCNSTEKGWGSQETGSEAVNRTSTGEMCLDFRLSAHVETNSKWIKAINSKFPNFNVRMKTMALLEENIGKYLHILVVGQGFLKKKHMQKKTKKQHTKQNP